MNWFQGSIPEAIGASRVKKTIFVVVVTSDDETSTKLLATLEEEKVAKFFSNFVTISLKNGSVEAGQFGQLYPLVIIPSIYMIGLEGSPLEVIGGPVESEAILTKAQKALELHIAKENIPAPVQIQPAETSGASAHVADLSNGSPQKNDESEAAAETNSGESEATPAVLPLEVRVEKANELVTELRRKKEEEEREKEKREERERRERGKQVHQMKQAQQEREQRELVESRQKQKREEKEALDKIRQQIAQDKADRAARYQNAKASEEERKKAAQIAQEQLKQERAAVAAARSAFTRLQFRLPDGSTCTHQFASDQKLADVANHIDQQIQPPFKSYSLCTTFPRRVLASEDMGRSLCELDLTPSAALLIVPSDSTSYSTSSNVSAGSSWMNWMLSSVHWIWNWLTSFVFPAPLNLQAPPTPQPRQPANEGGVRRRGNIRRLADASGDDSDDNATWNGNSTQQL